MARAGNETALRFTVHPHMLRHSIGFYLANHGYDTRAIQNYFDTTTMRYMSCNQFIFITFSHKSIFIYMQIVHIMRHIKWIE